MSLFTNFDFINYYTVYDFRAPDPDAQDAKIPEEDLPR